MERRLDSTGLDPVTATEYERVDFWIQQLDRLDRVLEKPATSLIRLAEKAIVEGVNDAGRTKIHLVPTTIDEKQPRLGKSLLIHAVVCATVQRLDHQRRRFSWLKPHQEKLRTLRERLPNSFLEHPSLKAEPIETIEALSDETFGNMSPLIASEVFWLLVRAGEKYAHGNLGFLALFGLLWALQRRLHGPFEIGASLGSWRPTVTVTARCLMPILKLNSIVEERAKLWRESAEVCEKIEESAAGQNQWESWRFASGLDRLASVLHELAEVSIEPEDFHDAADAITKIAQDRDPRSPATGDAAPVRAEMRELFAKLREQNRIILKDAEHATGVVQKKLLRLLKSESTARRKLGADCHLVPEWKLQYEAANRAHRVCVRALRELQKAVALCGNLPRGKRFTHKLMTRTLERLAVINDRIDAILSKAIEDNIEWCVRGVTREVALASAKNDTDFDVAGLLSGIVIAERTHRISQIEVADAIRLSLRVAREDGSWWSGQPVFLEKRAVGVWPTTPDVVLLLSTAIKAFDDIECADSHLNQFVDWLELREVQQHPAWWKEKEPLWGWASEARESSIDVRTTATAVQALLEIRGIIEDRLWSICERRFTVLPNLKRLNEIDPVDLGARHHRRLQTRLLRNAARARLNRDDADYSYLLHGPPGTSKSVLGQAIGGEMWRNLHRKPRFVRITPADFTRRGEHGLDVEARFIFRLLSHVRGVTIFFDEIDDLLRVREVGAAPAFIRLVIPGMLNRLQDLRDAARSQEICFLLGTNYVDQIEPALIRPGRIDLPIPVPYPDAWSRESILDRIAGTGVSPELKEYVVRETRQWPWTTYQNLCKRLKDDPSPSRETADRFIPRLRLEFQPPDTYYQNAKRWTTSSPLVTEVVHVAFSESKDEKECLAKVAVLAKQLEGAEGVVLSNLDLLGKFKTEWDRGGRS